MWVAEPSQREDLRILVLAYLQGTSPKPPVDNAVDFYQAAKAAAVSSPAVVACNSAIAMFHLDLHVLGRQMPCRLVQCVKPLHEACCR